MVLVIAAAMIMFLSVSSKERKEKVNEKFIPAAGNGFVVMELFTSQGCSSCPPADDLLGKYAMQNDERIIPLAFHVDYWNRLGWKDSFSTSENTNRQQQYDEQFLHSTVYTPQLIINGQTEMVGSDREKINAAVNADLKVEPLVKIVIKNIKPAKDFVSIQYNASGLLDQSNIVAALVQDKAVTSIKGGENNGVQLSNYNVVRAFVTGKIIPEGMVSTPVPKYFNTSGYSIVLYTQNIQTGKITGAVKTFLK